MLPTIVCILLGLSIIKTTVSQPGSGDGSPGSDSDATFCLFNAIDIVPYLPSGATLTTSCCQLASGIGTNLLAVSIYDCNPANYFPPTHFKKRSTRRAFVGMSPPPPPGSPLDVEDPKIDDKVTNLLEMRVKELIQEARDGMVEQEDESAC